VSLLGWAALVVGVLGLLVVLLICLVCWAVGQADVEYYWEDES
jgi:hypothetical protein